MKLGEQQSSGNIAILLSALFLCSCATPTTNTPSLNSAAIKGEKQVEEKLVSEHKLKLEQERSREMLEFQKRLFKVGSDVAVAAVPLCNELAMASRNNDCVYSFEVFGESEKNKNPGVNAFADGKKIYVTKSMMRFASSDDELALILAHEYSHNMMEHISAQQKNQIFGAIVGALADGLAASQGVNTQGDFTKLGAEAAALSYSKDFETEADYVGMYILARAHKNYKSAPEIWRKLSLKQPDAIYVSTTHPSNPERFVLMEKVAQEIDRKKKMKEPLLPNLKTKESQNG